jgi:AcrR family transcriptional regulator
MANVKNNLAAQETKRKLIEAAGEVFAEYGFERATIKQITDRAGASLAAVNYHFSDKHELYYQVIRHSHQTVASAMAMVKDLSPQLSPEQRLRAFIGALLGNMLDPSLPKWQGLLLWREMQQPTAATERLISETFCDCTGSIEGLIAALVSRPIPHRELRLVVESVLGQCLFHVHHQEFHRRLFPDIPPAAERVSELADHIAAFSVAAIHCLYGRPPRATGL